MPYLPQLWQVYTNLLIRHLKHSELRVDHQDSSVAVCSKAACRFSGPTECKESGLSHFNLTSVLNYHTPWR